MVATHEHLFWFAPSAPGAVRPPDAVPVSAALPRRRRRRRRARPGSMSPWTDLATRDAVAQHLQPGPKLDVTSPYISGPDEFYPEMARLRSAAEGRAFVDMWADHGVTSFKLYMHVLPEVARAVVTEAHRRRRQGRRALVLHRRGRSRRDRRRLARARAVRRRGLRSDISPRTSARTRSRISVPRSRSCLSTIARVKRLVRDMIAHHVALSSTLPVFESFDIARYDRTTGSAQPRCSTTSSARQATSKRERMRVSCELRRGRRRRISPPRCASRPRSFMPGAC